MKHEFNTGIVGAGPGGITAAIQLTRCGIDFIMIEKREVGGLLMNANQVENFPGFPEGISGRELVNYFARHLERLRVDVLKDEVTMTNYKEGQFLIDTSLNGTIRAKNLVIVSGTRPREGKWSGLGEDAKKRIFYEVLPLLNVKDKRIAVIGAGDAAFDYALNLGALNQVFILNRSKKTKCLPLLEVRAGEMKSIRYMSSTRVTEIGLTNDGLELSLETSGEIRNGTLNVHFLLAAIGRDPVLDFLSPLLLRSYEGKIKIPGLYFCGDVIRGMTRQATVSIGDGMHSAMDIYLRSRETG